MRLLTVIMLLLALAGCAMQRGTTSGTATEVLVTRDASGWVARFSFPKDAPIWAFQRSALLRVGNKPWRPESWRVETPGVALERIGDFDALVAAQGSVPRSVTVRFTPLGEDLIADYDPAIILSDGTLALYTGHFRAFPMTGRDALAALQEPEDFESHITFEAGGAPMLYEGRQVTRARNVGENYVFIGDAQVDPEAPVATILDPGLPSWLAKELKAFTPTIFTEYAQMMGPHGGSRPMVIASWAGADLKGYSQGGSVTPGLITMRLEGAQLVEESPRAIGPIRWFIAHEAAHFWLGRKVHYDNADQAWITEGGADFLAMRAGARHDPLFDTEGFLANARRDCAASLANGALAQARRRNEHRAYYACGSLFALVVDEAGRARSETFADFARRLIAANPDREVTRDDWLAEARRFGVTPEKIALMRAIVSGEGMPQDPVARLLES